ncbi:tRNA nuclease CdiA-2 [Dyella sp. AD56]|uniref:two-partner secretion domain-containing protein n=1 Tax=Dyella sp. AD56 TaxID=1528744 RepID=UPI000C83B1C7|nr:filamentous hemagglutinin N-terminal domain-containing protein [Dyella sp. AD56]PMQ04315.1 tRNA nuclease CdiA-2 [Dyella sp. AD56]
MNKHLYRIVFNHALGVFQVVSELVRRPGRGASRSDGVVAANVRPVSLGLWVAFGWIGLASVASAQIAGDAQAPGNQRPTVMAAPNNAPLINIQTPSAAGVSRNTYNRFDVGNEGAVLNNSRTNTQTQLAGTVSGNPWLATGTAKVILNEVTGPHPSQLNGYIEVAGDRAQVVIANPSGIACDGCGFINANRVTLTTGVPVLNGGSLDGYRVTSGTIQINGKGMDASRADYADIIARAVQVNGGIWSPQLQITTGANQVSVDQSQISATSADGNKPAFALDVSALGGMYANKIALLGTEHGLGVRNAGTIGAQAGELIVTVDGRLENTGSLQSQANTQIAASGGVANAGTISAARELTVATPGDVDNSQGTLNAMRIAVDAASLRNAGGSIAQTGSQGMALNAGVLSNRNGGRIGVTEAGTGTGSGGSTDTPANGTGTAGSGNGSTSETPSSGNNTPSVVLPVPLADGALHIAGLLDNDGGRISAAAGFDLNTSSGLANDGGQLALHALTLTGGDLSNHGGTLVIDGASTVHANQVSNDGGQLSFAKAVAFDAQSLSNRSGSLTLADASPMTLTVAGTLDNTDGTLATNAKEFTLNSGALINAHELSSNGGVINHTGTGGFTLLTGDWQGANGTVVTAGTANVTAGRIDHRGATLSATQLTLHATDLDNRGGVIVVSDAAPNTLLVAGTLDNGERGIIQTQGDLTITAATLGNAGGIVSQVGAGALSIQAAAVQGQGGTLASKGDLTLVGGAIDLRGGNTYAQRIDANADTLTTAGGTFTSLGNASQEGTSFASPMNLTVRGLLDNTGGAISSNGALQLNADALANTDGHVIAAGVDASNITVANVLDNTRGELATMGATTVRGGIILNQGGTLQTGGGATLTVTASGLLDNSQHGTLTSNGDLTLAASTFDNTLGAISHAGNGTLTVQASSLHGQGGSIGSNGSLVMKGGVLDLRGGVTQAQALSVDAESLNLAQGKLTILGGSSQEGTSFASPLRFNVRGLMDNTGGEVTTNGALQLNAGSLANVGGKFVVIGTDATVIAIDNVFDNTRGELTTMGATTVHGNTIVNQAGTIQVGGDSALTVTADGLLDNSAKGTLTSTGDLHVTATTLDNTTGAIQHAGQGMAAITANTLNGQGGTIASNGALTLTGGAINLSSGTTQARAITVEADSLNTTAGATLQALGTDPLTLHVRNTLDNSGGKIITNGALAFSAGSLLNRSGTLAAAGMGASDLRVNGIFDNSGGLFAITGTTTVHAGSLDNTAGTVQAAASDVLTLTTDGALTNDQGRLVTNGALSLASGSVSNHRGTLQAQQGINANVTGTLDNNSGTLVAGGNLDVQAQSLLNHGVLSLDTSSPAVGLYGQRVTLRADNLDNTQGHVQAAGDLTITGATLNNTGGVLDGTGTVSVSADTVDNTSGQLIQHGDSGALTIQANQALTNKAGGLVGAEGTANLSAGSIDNSGGTLFAQHNLSVGSTGALLNRDGGQVQTHGALTLNARGTLDNSGGHIDATGVANLSAGTISNAGGQILAGNSSNPNAGLNVTSASSIDNRGGTIGNRVGDVTLSTTRLDNSAGGTLVALRDLALGSVGTLNNAGGTTYATRDLRYQNGNATLDNTGGTFGAGGTAWLTLGTLTNTSGHVQADTLWLTTPVLNNGGGAISANALHATLTTLNGLGTLRGANSLDAHILGDYTLAAGQQLQSDGTLSLAVDGTLTNQGTLQTQGTLNVTAANLINQGTINASNGNGSASATVSAGGQIDNRAGASIEGDTLTLNASDVTNTSSRGITGDVVRINANTLTNGRDLGTGDAAVAYGEGFIGASQKLDLRIAQRLANLDGDIYSGGDLTIAGRADGARVATLDNVSGRIQAEGNGSIAADAINNRRRVVETAQYTLSADEQYALSSERAYDNALTPAEVQRMSDLYTKNNGSSGLTIAERQELISYVHRQGYVHVDQVDDTALAAMNVVINQDAIQNHGHQGAYIVVGSGGNPGAEFKQIDTYLTGTRVTRASADSQILTGGNLAIDLGTHLTNFASTIAATGDLNINGQHGDPTADARIENIAVLGQYTLQRETDILSLSALPVHYWDKGGKTGETHADFFTNLGTENITAAGPALLASTITGRHVSISGRDIANTAVAVGGGITTWSGDGLSGPASVSLGSTSRAQAGGAGGVIGAQGQAVDGIGNVHGGQGNGVGNAGTVSGSGAQVVGSAQQPLPGLVAPSSGKYTQNGDPSAPFLVTTTPRFAKGPVTSSDYLLRALGQDPDNIHKRLGDGYLEQNLVLDQLLQLTGRRTLTGDDGLAQYQALMDGAAAEAARQGLQLGAPLTSAQINALSSDIVWLVDQVVDGQHVLVPVVYLSKNTADRLRSDGALIAGDNVDIKASGTVRNDGTITGTQSMNLSADTLINRGTLNAGDRLAIATQNDTINNGVLKANSIGIVAGGSVVNAPVFDGLAAHGGTIAAGTGGAQIIAANDVINQGKISSAGSAAIVAGRDYVQNAATSTVGSHAPAGSLSAGGNATVIAGRDAIFDQSTVNAGQVAVINAGRDAHFTAATVSGGTGVGVVAGRDIISDTVTSSTTTASFDKQGKTVTKTETTETTTKGSTFQSGGSISMQAGRDLDLTAATVDAGGAVGLSAGRDINLGAAQNTHAETQNISSKHGSTRTDTHSAVEDTAMVGTTISGKQGVVMSAGQDINALAANIASSDGAVVLHADRDINLLVGQNTHSETVDTQTTKKGFLNKKETTTHDATYDATAVGTTISGKSGIALDAGHNVLGIGTTLESSAGGIAITAGNQVAFLAASDTHSTEHSEKVRRSGVEWVPNPKQGTQKKTTTTEQITAVGSTLDAAGPIVVVSGGDQTWQAANIKSDTGTALVSGRAINFVTATNSDTYQRDSSKHNVAYQAQDHRLRVDTTEQQTSITGPVTMAAANGINVAIGQRAGETQAEAIARSAEANPSSAWIYALQDNPRVTWQSVDEKHIDEHQHQEGVTKAAATVITVVVSYFTAGAASSWIGGTLGSSGGTFAAATATTSAGMGNAILTGAVTGAAAGGASAGAQGYNVGQGMWQGLYTGAVSGGLFHAAGQITTAKAAGGWADATYKAGSLEKVAAHMAAGGINSGLMGGNVWNGVLSGGFSEWSSPYVDKMGGTWAQTMGHAGRVR